MGRDEAMRGGFEGTSRPTRRITPEDVQRKEFGTARVRVGYLMHEVDEFLDEVTDTLSSLSAENEQLRAQLAASPRASTAAPPPGATRPTDRAAVEAFLQREKSFLQSLGSLVQDHAEELKGMVRSARGATSARRSDSDRPAPPPTAAPAADDAPSPGTSVSDGADPPSGPPASASPAGTMPSAEPIEAAPSSSPATEASGADDAAVLDGDDGDTRAIESVEAEAPIVVDEPEPTGSRRRDEPSEGSLRELFWGEE